MAINDDDSNRNKKEEKQLKKKNNEWKSISQKLFDNLNISDFNIYFLL